MSAPFALFAIALFAGAAILSYAFARHLIRHVEHVRRLLAFAQNYTPDYWVRDSWGERCVHCHRHLRDAPVAEYSRDTADRGIVTAVFHRNREKCFEHYVEFGIEWDEINAKEREG